MRFRLWNSFNLLAVILLAIGIIGAFSGGHMVFDPGRIPSGKEWIIYLIAGALMLVNGFLPSNTIPETKVINGKKPADSEEKGATAAVAAK